jgi:Domain of unknown function (DUF4440)
MIDTLAQKYAEAVNSSDASAVAAFCTEDAVFVSERGPVYGREAIEKLYSDLFIAWRSVVPSGWPQEITTLGKLKDRSSGLANLNQPPVPQRTPERSFTLSPSQVSQSAA